VLGLRKDGFHELETLFELIDLCDEISFKASSDGKISLECDDKHLDCGPSNLICKAAELLKQTSRVKAGVSINLSKKIPIAAGLGGGSSDAASTLLSLNQLWGIGLSQEELMELGANLGSDVVFFLKNSSFAVGRGRGELLDSVEDTQPIWHVLVVPNAGLSTKLIYEDFDNREKTDNNSLTENESSLSICLHALRNGSLSELAKGMRNDLESLAIRRCPIITEIHKALRDSGCITSLLSGSGSAVFGLCSNENQASQISTKLYNNPSFWDFFVRPVKTRQPLRLLRGGYNGNN